MPALSYYLPMRRSGEPVRSRQICIESAYLGMPMSLYAACPRERREAPALPGRNRGSGACTVLVRRLDRSRGKGRWRREGRRGENEGEQGKDQLSRVVDCVGDVQNCSRNAVDCAMAATVCVAHNEIRMKIVAGRIQDRSGTRNRSNKIMMIPSAALTITG